MDAGVAHRGPMSDDVSVLQRDLERYRINNESLTMNLKMAIQNNNRGAAAAKGFTLMHLLLVGASSFGHSFLFFLFALLPPPAVTPPRPSSLSRVRGTISI